MVLTRTYVYSTDVRSSEGIVHRKGDRVLQVPDLFGYWRDVDYLKCVSGEFCKDQANCHCQNCKIYKTI